MFQLYKREKPRRCGAAARGDNLNLMHVFACRNAPFLIAFEERAQVFQTVISADRGRRREMGAYGPQSFVTIHRDTLMQVTVEPSWPFHLVMKVSKKMILLAE